MFVYIRARFHVALISGIVTAQLMQSHRGIEVKIQIPETQLQALLPFPATPACKQALWGSLILWGRKLVI